MSGTKQNESRVIDFHCGKITGRQVKNVAGLEIPERSVVVNVGSVPAVLGGEPVTEVAPRKSTLVERSRVLSAENVVIVRVEDEENIGSMVLQEDWKSAPVLYGPPLEGVALWRSPQEEIGTIELDPRRVTGEALACDGVMTFDMRVNLWFAPGRTDCAIHNHTGPDDDFIEFHTQIYGIGRMQKFRRQDKSTLYEDVVLAEGNTHEIFCSTNAKTNRFDYPWHQYYSDNDCVWLVVELHPQR